MNLQQTRDLLDDLLDGAGLPGHCEVVFAPVDGARIGVEDVVVEDGRVVLTAKPVPPGRGSWHDRFVRAWQAAESVREVAGQFNIDAATAASRACMLRRKGVPLKMMRANRHHPEAAPDYEEIKRLAEEPHDL